MTTIFGAGDPTSGYEIENSMMLNNASTSGLLKTFDAAGNRRTFTFSTWFKGSVFPQFSYFTGQQTGGQNYFQLGTDDEGSFRVFSGDNSIDCATIALFKDPTAWYHIVFAFDTTQGTASNRVKIYVNGILRELCKKENFTTSPILPGENDELYYNTGDAFGVGIRGDSDTPPNGYMAETYFIDGAQEAASDFGEFNDQNIWIPKNAEDVKEALTFGTNGFLLEYKQTGTSQNSSGKGADTSGNDNHFNDSNMGTEHITTDTPTNNFCILNFLTRPAASTGLTLQEGGTALHGNQTDAGFKGTIGVSTGKWYWEVKATAASSGADRVLVATEDVRQITSATDPSSEGIFGIQSNGSGNNINSYTNGTFSNNNSLQGYDDNTIISVALDLDNYELYFAIDGTYKNLANQASNPANRTNPAFASLPSDGRFFFPYVENRSNATPTSIVNFGQPFFSISSGNSDAAGYGNFEYAPPSGFFSLCTKNLATKG